MLACFVLKQDWKDWKNWEKLTVRESPGSRELSVVCQRLFCAAERLSRTSLRLDIQMASEEPFSSATSIGGSYKPTLNPHLIITICRPRSVAGNAPPLKKSALDTVHFVQDNSAALK